jgi:hypothetical protein
VHCKGFAPAAPRKAWGIVSVPISGLPLLRPLSIIGLVSHYLANYHNRERSYPLANIPHLESQCTEGACLQSIEPNNDSAPINRVGQLSGVDRVFEVFEGADSLQSQQYFSRELGSGSLVFPAVLLDLSPSPAWPSRSSLVRRPPSAEASGCWPPGLDLSHRALVRSVGIPRDVRQVGRRGFLLSWHYPLAPLCWFPSVRPLPVTPKSFLWVAGTTRRHRVPSSWFLTTSTACSAQRLRVCCTPLPTLRFAAFQAASNAVCPKAPWLCAAFLATRFIPFKGFPSSVAVPHHCGLCPLTVGHKPPRPNRLLSAPKSIQRAVSSEESTAWFGLNASRSQHYDPMPPKSHVAMRVTQPKPARILPRFTEVSRERRRFIARQVMMLQSAETNPHIATPSRPETEVSDRGVPGVSLPSKLGDEVTNRSDFFPKASIVLSRIPDSRRSGSRESRSSALDVAGTPGEPVVLLSCAAPRILAPSVSPVARRTGQRRSRRVPRFQGFSQLMSPLQSAAVSSD